MASRNELSRRTFLRGVGLSGAAIRDRIAGVRGAVQCQRDRLCGRRRALAAQPIETRFVLWFNGNGIVEKYWIPREDGAEL